VSTGFAPTVHALVAAGADTTVKNVEGETAFDIAKRSNFTEPMRALKLDLSGQSPDFVDEDGWTFAMHAANHGNVEMLQALVKSGADLNLQNPKGKTAAMLAAGRGHATALKLLKGESLNTATEDGGTPAMSAAVHGRAEALKVLCELGANINTQDEDGWTALMYAAVNGDPVTTATLVAAKADVTLKNSDGDTAFTLAHARKHGEVERALGPDAAIFNAPIKA